MVMGFNTDIKYDGVIYHVQTEPRKDSGIDTTVYTGEPSFTSSRVPARTCWIRLTSAMIN